jgi:hypothetical protein
MIRTLLTLLVTILPKRVITRDDGDPYLERYYLCGDPGGLKYFPGETIRWWQRALTWLPCIYVHRFRRDDADQELHNHPWTAVSLIVAGGYVEERRVVDPGNPYRFRTVRKFVKPWRLNRLEADTFHRVELAESDCWSIIKLGPKVQTWGFWNPATGEFLHWKDHLKRREKRVNGARFFLDTASGEELDRYMSGQHKRGYVTENGVLRSETDAEFRDRLKRIGQG